jgi:RNA polymerase sigma-70 factor (ECF subfamily)
MMASGVLGRESVVGSAGVPDTDDEFMRGLYERYRLLLQGYVARLTRDVYWAEDIVQAVLVRAWRNREQLVLGEAATRSWLFTAAYRLFVDEYRVRANRSVELGEQQLAAAGSGVDEFERMAWSVTLAGALEALSERHRQVIVYVYYLNRTIDETADLLGVSPGTVKSRLHYAVRALRNQLSTGPQL